MKELIKSLLEIAGIEPTVINVEGVKAYLNMLKIADALKGVKLV